LAVTTLLAVFSGKLLPLLGSPQVVHGQTWATKFWHEERQAEALAASRLKPEFQVPHCLFQYYSGNA